MESFEGKANVKTVNGQAPDSGGNVEVGFGNINEVLPINKGGTGANNAIDACSNLGALPISGGALTGIVNFLNAQGLNFALFKHPQELGLTSSSVNLLQIFNAMPDCSIFIGSAGINNVITDVGDDVSRFIPRYNGIFIIIRIKEYRSFILNAYCTQNISATNIAYSHFYSSNANSSKIDSLASWQIFGREPSIAASNNGYCLLENNLIFAWARYGGGASSSDVVVTKPYSDGFTTLIAQATDSGNSGRNAQRWNSGNSTKTTDTFEADNSGDAFTVFWVGKV